MNDSGVIPQLHQAPAEIAAPPGGPTLTSAVDTITPPERRRSIAGRVWAGVVAAWGLISGLAPHVLHHVGPLAGAALLAGFGGKALFFALGLVLSLPLLRRLYRRFKTWLAPALAVLLFAGMFSLSALLIAPRLTGSGKTPAPGLEQPSAPSGHAGHHKGDGE